MERGHSAETDTKRRREYERGEGAASQRVPWQLGRRAQPAAQVGHSPTVPPAPGRGDVRAAKKQIVCSWDSVGAKTAKVLSCWRGESWGHQQHPVLLRNLKGTEEQKRSSVFDANRASWDSLRRAGCVAGGAKPSQLVKQAGS